MMVFSTGSGLILLGIVLVWNFVLNRFFPSSRKKHTILMGAASGVTWAALSFGILVLFILLTGEMWYPNPDILVNTGISCIGGSVFGYFRWKKKEEVKKEEPIQAVQTQL